MAKNPDNHSSQALVDELDQLVDMLGDGPEYQHEIPLPYERKGQQSFAGLEKSGSDGPPPMLTSIYDTDPVTGEMAQIDVLIEELIEELMPRFETILRARLRTRLKSPKK